MSKVDLIDNSWVDLVFEGKNKEYGAYVLRKETGKRNVKAMAVVLRQSLPSSFSSLPKWPSRMRCLRK